MFQSELIDLANKRLSKTNKDKCTEGEHRVLVIGSLLRQAIPINIQPVSDYLYHGTEQEDWYLEKDFPNLAPPWELAWLHWNPPTWVRSEGMVVNAPVMADYDYGCLVVGMPSDKLVYSTNDPNKRLIPPPSSKWLTCFYLFGQNRVTNVISCYTLKFFVNHQGEGLFLTGGLHVSDPFAWPSGEWRRFVQGSGPFSPKSRFKLFDLVEKDMDTWLHEHPGDSTNYRPTIGDKKEWGPIENDVIGTLFPVFLAISFCHCKNVEIKDIPIPDKVLKKRAARGVWSPKIRREIHIEPMKKILRATPGTRQTDLKKQLVIRRGHFKDFKEGRGLFGKHHGLYWWESWVKDTTDTTNVSYQIEGKS